MVPIAWLAGLLVAGTLVNWLRKRSWFERAKGPWFYAAVGAGVGVIALVLGLVIGTPIVERFSDQAVQWSMYPIVRGSAGAFFTVAVLVAVGALASELVFRAWLTELADEFAHSKPVAVVMGAFIEALLTEGDATTKLGAGLFGLGLGTMYFAGGRSVLAPLCARVTFALGAVALEALRLVG